MSNYIKIEMEDGKTLTGATLTTSGGGTIAGYDARNGVEVFTSTGEGSGATINVTMGDRALDPASSVLTDPASYGTAGDVGFATTAGTATLSAVIGGGTFDIQVNTDVADGTILSVAVNAAGGYKVGDVITIDVPSGSAINASGGDQLITVVALSDSDLVAPAETDLVYTIDKGGTGYANGDVLFLDIQGSGPANEISWSALIQMTVSNLSGYDDGPFVLVPIDNAWMCGTLNGSNELGPVTGSGIAVFYQEADINNKTANYPGLKVCNITFSGVSTDAQRRIIMENMNSLILQASAAENSQPYLTMPAGVKGVEVSFG